jgi:hypothetical protein
MQNYENRIINGILKADNVALNPDDVANHLSSDIQIIVDNGRMTSEDLWACVWSLAKVLEKQFLGKIYIRGNQTWSELPCPSKLSKRVIFTTDEPDVAFTIGIGIKPRGVSEERCIFGDACGSRISFGNILLPSEPAHPISCFALGGYLGFAALAKIVGIPDFRDDYTEPLLNLPFTPDLSRDFKEGLTFIGLGQLGQAYLSLLFFLNKSVEQEIILIDKDRFEDPNYNTQILLNETKEWIGEPKTRYLEGLFKGVGWNVCGEKRELKWGYSRPPHHPSLAVLGLDKFEPRRIAINAGYDWIFESGLGTSFLQPRFSWHSLLPTESNEKFFKDLAQPRESEQPFSEFEKDLQDLTPGGCGWVTYKSIAATAPSMGLVASAFVWSEIFNYSPQKQFSVEGSAYLWTSGLPFTREFISAR